MRIKENILIAHLLLFVIAATFTLAGSLERNTAMVLPHTDSRNTDLIDLRAEPRGMVEDHDMVEKPKSKPWLGYYDFLITEGSYKFWVVFELFTVALLIYSAFAAIYYAKYTVTDYDYDYFFKKRSARSVQQDTTFFGLPAETYTRIFEAISDLKNQYS